MTSKTDMSILAADIDCCSPIVYSTPTNDELGDLISTPAIEELNDLISKKNSVINELEAEIKREKEKYQIRMEHITKKNSEIQDELNKVKETYARDVDQHKKLKEIFDEEKGKVGKLEKDLSKKAKLISELGIQVSKLKTTNQQLVQKSKTADERLDVLKTTNADLEETVRLLQGQIASYETAEFPSA